jgi:hypothetical protein
LGCLPAMLFTMAAIFLESRTFVSPEADRRPSWILAHGYVLGAVAFVAWVRPWQ